MIIEEHLNNVRQRIRQAEKRYQRKPGSVQLLAVSKAQPVESILEAYAAGQRLFGENYVNEALLKIEQLQDKSDIVFHFIGNIQSNKTRLIAQCFDWVHSVSRKKILERLNQQRPHNALPLNICLEVNLDREESKGGFTLNQIEETANFFSKYAHLKLRGLMAIPAHRKEFDAQRAVFAKLRIAYQDLNKKGFKLDTLSMGMSNDLEAAIAEGATMVRVGSAIFGDVSN